MNQIDVYTDGGASPNPGKGGWAVVLLEKGSKTHEYYGGELDTSNNRMELTAVITALQNISTETMVNIHTDSQYVRQGITLWINSWKRNGWRTADKKAVKNQDLWKTLDALVKNRKINWNWVKGHDGNEWNEYVDQLVNKARQELE